MKYINFTLMALGLTSVVSGASAKDNPKPNVLVFLIDDLRPQLGCYGYTAVKSPNIDALAESGVTFKRAYVQEAISAPSRMSILSGLRPENIGIYSLFTPFRSKHPDEVTIPQFFKEHDYKTISVGKVYHHTTDDKQSWTTLIPRAGSNYVLEENNVQGVKGAPYECADVADEEYMDGQTTQSAIEMLKEHKDENFVMFVGLTKPHLPFSAPKKYWDMYDRESFEIPFKGAPTGMNQYSMAPWNELRAYKGMPAQGFLDDENSLTLIHGYHACVSYMDAQVGKVMAELERLNLRENTVVILLGDHGWKIGEYGAWCKHSNCEIDANIPFIISRELSSKKAKRGVESDGLIEAVDLYPTMVDLCGLEVEGKDGQSIVPLTERPNMKWSKASYSLYPRGKNVMGFTCTDGTFRYTEWWSNVNSKVLYREFYTCEQDFSQQMANLVDQSEYSDDVARLKVLLDRQFPESRRSGYPQYDGD